MFRYQYRNEFLSAIENLRSELDYLSKNGEPRSLSNVSRLLSEL